MNESDPILREKPNLPDTAGTFAVPPLQFDPDDFREYIAECELTERQEDELLGVLWSIMCNFVAIGYGLDSVQLFSTTKTSGQEDISGPDSGNMPPTGSTPKRFNKAADQRQNKED